MSLRRRRKADRIKPSDFGLEELSKINREDTVRVMDRSRERTGEKLSDESGLYVPKREPYYYDIQKISPQNDYGENKRQRRVLSAAEKDDYNYGKVFAVGEQYIDKEDLGIRGGEDFYKYSENEDFEDDYYDIDSFFDENEGSSVHIKEVVTDQAEELRKRAQSAEINNLKDDVITGQNSITEKNDSREDTIAEQADRKEEISFEHIDAALEQILEYNKITKEDVSDEIPYNVQLNDKTEEVPYNVQHKDKTQGVPHNVQSNNFSDDTQQQSGQYMEDEEEYEPVLDAEKEKLLKAAIDSIEGSASAKEKLAAQREAIRLGMVDALVDTNRSDMVRPELLEEMGFTPGGEKEPEIVKNKRFIFGRKKKKKAVDEVPHIDLAADDSAGISENVNKTDASKLKAANDKVPEKKKAVSKKSENKKSEGRKPEVKERRSEMMRDSAKREIYIRKNKMRLEKAGNDLMDMQEKYDNLTRCLNDIIMLGELPEDVSKNIRNTAGMLVKYRQEKEKSKKGSEMDEDMFLRINANKDELPDTIKRLTENEKTLDKLKKQINEIDEKKGECREETEETEYKRKRTKNISIAVIVCTFVTMAILITAQVALKLDMQIVILLFGVCVILETLGIFVQHFKAETDETTNHYKLNKLIKKQNSIKVNYVNILNAVEYVYKKYNIHSSSELLFLWETYQRAVQSREDYKIAGKEVSYYENRLKTIFEEYGLRNSNIWIEQADYLIENEKMDIMKDKMAGKRNKLMGRMEKCKKFMAKLDSELSVLVIKYPQYADEIRAILNEV